jgi:hypothetical protein
MPLGPKSSHLLSGWLSVVSGGSQKSQADRREVCAIMVAVSTCSVPDLLCTGHTLCLLSRAAAGEVGFPPPYNEKTETQKTLSLLWYLMPVSYTSGPPSLSECPQPLCHCTNVCGGDSLWLSPQRNQLLKCFNHHCGSHTRAGAHVRRLPYLLWGL